MYEDKARVNKKQYFIYIHKIFTNMISKIGQKSTKLEELVRGGRERCDTKSLCHKWNRGGEMKLEIVKRTNIGDSKRYR